MEVLDFIKLMKRLHNSIWTQLFLDPSVDKFNTKGFINLVEVQSDLTLTDNQILALKQAIINACPACAVAKLRTLGSGQVETKGIEMCRFCPIDWGLKSWETKENMLCNSRNTYFSMWNVAQKDENPYFAKKIRDSWT